MSATRFLFVSPNLGGDSPPGGATDRRKRLDAELKRQMIHDVQAWIEAAIGEPITGPTLHDGLKDGVVLCRLANTIKPGAVSRVHASGNPFKQMENINFFVHACDAHFGLGERELFLPSDLHDGKNLPRVFAALHALAERTSRQPGFDVPRFGRSSSLGDRRLSREASANSSRKSSTDSAAPLLPGVAGVAGGIGRLSLSAPTVHGGGAPGSGAVADGAFHMLPPRHAPPSVPKPGAPVPPGDGPVASASPAPNGGPVRPPQARASASARGEGGGRGGPSDWQTADPAAPRDGRPSGSAGCSIAEAAERGIRLRQLESLVAAATAAADQQHAASAAGVGSASAERPSSELASAERETERGDEAEPLPLSLRELVAHHLAAHRSTTTAAGGTAALSLAEIVASGAQRPAWVVVHRQAVAAAEVLRCVRQHAHDRGLGEDAVYWLLPLAARLLAPTPRLGAAAARAGSGGARGWADGPAAAHAGASADDADGARALGRALDLGAEGVLLVLDGNGEGALTDAVCLRQLAALLARPGAQLDVYHPLVTSASACCGLTERPVSADEHKYGMDYASYAQAEREASFPLHVAHAVLGERVARAAAAAAPRAGGGSAEAGGALLDGLRARFASLVLALLMAHEEAAEEAPRPEQPGPRVDEALRAYCAALSRSSSLAVLRVQCAERPPAERCLLLGQSLPPSLDELRCEALNGEAFAPPLAQLLATSARLRAVRLRECGLRPSGAQALAAGLGASASLTALDLAKNRIGDAGAAALASALSTNRRLQLASLDLSANRLGDDGARALAGALAQCGSLRQLNLLCNGFGAQTATQLAEACNRPTKARVHSLCGLEADRTCAYLSDAELGDVDLALLAHDLASLRQLAELDLRYNKATDAGAIALADGLKANGSLTALDLCRNKVGDAGAAALASALRAHRSLAMLDLQFNAIADDGAVALAGALTSNTALSALYLYNNKISERGARAFEAALRANESLSVLWLGGNEIGAEGKKCIVRSWAGRGGGLVL